MRIFLSILKITSIAILAILILVILLILGIFISYKIWIGKAPPLPKEPVIHAHNNPDTEGTTYETQAELISAMGVGWNAGNTMDMPMGAKFHSQPILQKELFVKIKELGFDSIRIPMTWHYYTSKAPEYKIQPERLARAKQVVDQALEAGLIVIINSHHDNSMYTPTPENAENAVTFVSAVWSQIAEVFKDYDQNLIFEPLNEPTIKGSEHEWHYDESCAECIAKVKVIANCNQAFIDAVRKSGGRNAERYLLLKSYGPVPGNAIRSFRTLPSDSAENKLMIAVNNYTPFDLAFQGDFSRSKFKASDKHYLMEEFNSLYNAFVKRGIHVVYTEMGMTNKNNPEERYKWAEYFISANKKLGIACFVWDNGNTDAGVEGFGIVNKKTGKVYPEAQRYYEGLIDGIKEDNE